MALLKSCQTMKYQNKHLLCFYVFNFLLLLFTYYQIVDSADEPQHGNKKIICYISTWTTYRSPHQFTPNDIDATLCTHLVYLYVALNNDTQDNLVSNSPYTDLFDNHGLGYYEKITSMKTRYPHLKVLLCVGGWLQGSENFSKLARSETKRRIFANNAANYLRKHNFDGLDIFWRYPTKRGGIPEDKENFVKLLQALKNEFKNHGYLLTVYLSEERDIIEKGYDLAAIGQIVDIVSLNAHSYHTPWGLNFGISSPLESSDSNNVKNSVNYYLDHGITNDKLVIVLATNGFGYTNTNKLHEAKGLVGLYNDDIGYLTYFEICGYLKDSKSGWIETWDNVSSTPIASKENSKISYENVRSMEIKAKFVYEKKLAGVAISTLDGDDYLGLCDSSNNINEDEKKFPLVRAISKKFELLLRDDRNQTSESDPNNGITIVIHEF